MNTKKFMCKWVMNKEVKIVPGNTLNVKWLWIYFKKKIILSIMFFFHPLKLKTLWKGIENESISGLSKVFIPKHTTLNYCFCVYVQTSVTLLCYCWNFKGTEVYLMIICYIKNPDNMITSFLIILNVNSKLFIYKNI